MTYWVQIELKPEGSNTFGIQIDLEKVRRVLVCRDQKKLDSIKVIYSSGGVKEELVLDGDAAASFLDKWARIIELKQTDPEAEPSTILISRDTKGTK